MNEAVTTTTKDTPTTNEAEAEAPDTQPETDNSDTEVQSESAIADMWGAVDADLDGEDAPTSEEAPSEEEPEPETEAEPAQETEQPAPAEQKAAEPEAETPTEEQPSSQEEAKRTEPEPEPVDVDALWNQREQALVDEHRIDDDLADAVITDPKEHLPKLLAKAQARAERMIWENVNQAMPEAIQQVLSQQQTETEQKSAFYEAWPQLAEYVKQNPTAEQTITRMRDMFLQQPDAKSMSEEEIIRQVGAAATVALGVPQQAPQQQHQQNNTRPAKRETPRSSAAPRSASAGQGKKLGAFEALDMELDPGDSESGDGKGAVLF